MLDTIFHAFATLLLSLLVYVGCDGPPGSETACWATIPDASGEIAQIIRVEVDP